MHIPVEEGMDVISTPRVTNIHHSAAELTTNLEEYESVVLEANRLDCAIEAQSIASTNITSQLIFLLLSAIKLRLVEIDLTRIRTLFGILDIYQMKVAKPNERVNWRSPG